MSSRSDDGEQRAPAAAAGVLNPFALAFSLLAYAYTLYVFTGLIVFVYDGPTHVAFVDAAYAGWRVGKDASQGANSAEPDWQRTSATLAANTAHNLLLLVPFYVQHSVMARHAFKRALAAAAPAYAHRPLFIIGASAALHFMMNNWRAMPAPHVWAVAEHTSLHAALAALYAVSWLMLFAATFHIDHFDLFGLRHGYLADAYTPVPFVEYGFYKYVRHPIMAFLIVAFFVGPTMSRARLLFAVANTAYVLFVGLPLEEASLRAEHPRTYAAYARAKPSLCPFA